MMTEENVKQYVLSTFPHSVDAVSKVIMTTDEEDQPLAIAFCHKDGLWVGDAAVWELPEGLGLYGEL